MYFNSLLEKRYRNRYWRIASHILFWLFFFWSFSYYNQVSFNSLENNPISYLSIVHATISTLVTFYILLYGVGNLIRLKHYVAAFFVFLFSIGVYLVLEYFGEQMMLHYCDTCANFIKEQNPEYYKYLQNGFIEVISSRLSSLGGLFLMVIDLAIPMTIAVALRYHKQYNENIILLKENTQLELNFLKAQVNPHFLFNTLNNLYGLIIHDRKEASAETVKRLSDFMRYSLNNANKVSIALTEEIELVENYIALEKLRLNHTKVVFEKSAVEEDIQVPPLLFIPLIENAFKYTLDTKHTTIELKLSLLNNVLRFVIENSFDEKLSTHHKIGTGLENLEKRLRIYFPEKYVYTATIKDAKYTAYLQLQL